MSPRPQSSPRVIDLCPLKHSSNLSTLFIYRSSTSPLSLSLSLSLFFLSSSALSFSFSMSVYIQHYLQRLNTVYRKKKNTKFYKHIYAFRTQSFVLTIASKYILKIHTRQKVEMLITRNFYFYPDFVDSFSY